MASLFDNVNYISFGLLMRFHCIFQHKHFTKTMIVYNNFQFNFNSHHFSSSDAFNSIVKSGMSIPRISKVKLNSYELIDEFYLVHLKLFFKILNFCCSEFDIESF